MNSKSVTLIDEFAEFYPRSLFNIKKGARLVLDQSEIKGHLQKPGLYVLYIDEEPFYIGKSESSVYKRLYDHANKFDDRRFRHWNYFSAYLVSDAKYLSQLEGLLITAIPQARNSANPHLKKLPLPAELKRIFAGTRNIQAP